MAEELDEGIENALNLVVLTTDRNGNMKKELKQTICETVSSLRNLFVKLKRNWDVKSSNICELEAEVSKVKTQLQRVKRDKAEKGHGEPSVIPSQEPAGSRVHGVPSLIPRQEPAGQWAREGLSLVAARGSSIPRCWLIGHTRRNINCQVERAPTTRHHYRLNKKQNKSHRNQGWNKLLQVSKKWEGINRNEQ